MWIKRNKRAIGQSYEKKAEDYLRHKGYQILGRNVTYRGGELDLVCELQSGFNRVLVFVEVRMRDGGSFLGPEESIRGRKLRNLRWACNRYLAGYRGAANQMRIDLIACDGVRLFHREGFIDL